MKKALILIGMIAVLALVAAPVFASEGTLYQKEGTSTDGTPSIIGVGPTGTDADNWTNWQYQTGSASWSGVYQNVLGQGWLTITDEGDSSVEVEADIELFCAETISNNKVYFHLGNIFTATTADLTAFIDGTFTTNSGMWIGISFEGTGKTEADFEKDGSGNFTGVILGGMVSHEDALGRAEENQMDVKILMNWGAGWLPPDDFGEGATGQFVDSLWWLVNNKQAGSYNYQWLIRLLPEPHQADGDYYLDPVVVACPAL